MTYLSDPRYCRHAACAYDHDGAHCADCGTPLRWRIASRETHAPGCRRTAIVQDAAGARCRDCGVPMALVPEPLFDREAQTLAEIERRWERAYATEGGPVVPHRANADLGWLIAQLKARW